MDEKNLSVIFDNKRKIFGFKKIFLAEKLGLHTNTIKRKIEKPSTFTLDELFILKKLFNVDTIEDIFSPEIKFTLNLDSQNKKLIGEIFFASK